MDCRRRDFLRMAAGGAALCPFAAPGLLAADAAPLHPAAHWAKAGDKRIACKLCPHECVVPEGRTGKCNVRLNRGGEYFTLVHSNPCSLNNDPIEKKPLFHFYPGTNAYSLATVGCNIECQFCQNWQISQFTPDQVASRFMTPDDIVRAALEAGSTSIAFTYSEPTIFYEYMRDICIAAKGTKLKKVIISNGYIQKEPQKELLKLLDGVKIDFKAFSESFYRDICSAHLRPVLDSLRRVKDSGVWLEMVMLTVPTLNDNERELDGMTKWIYQKLGPDVPIHFTRFHPMYKLKNLSPTPVKTLEKARKIALGNGLHFAYAGNVPGHPGEDTYCPSCQKTLIRRDGYYIVYNRIQGGRCPYCKSRVAGVWGS
jgi:pyruvate formate lyase activating enzyme